MTTEFDQAMRDILAAAQERASIAVDNWIPENIGDNLAGVIEEIATITTTYGTVPVTVLRVYNHDKYPDGSLMRVAWMGAVLSSKFDKYRPAIGDFVAIHYQEDVEPKSGMQAYKLLESVVIDHRTKQAKLPVHESVREPTREDLRNVDPVTGEIPPPMSADELRDRFHVPNPANEPLRPGETPL